MGEGRSDTRLLLYGGRHVHISMCVYIHICKYILVYICICPYNSSTWRYATIAREGENWMTLVLECEESHTPLPLTPTHTPIPPDSPRPVCPEQSCRLREGWESRDPDSPPWIPEGRMRLL